MSIDYFLADACHNTFLMVDLLDFRNLNSEQLEHIYGSLINANCDDAIILINGRIHYTNGYRFEMKVLGCDGHFGEFCGNGTRACAAYLFEKYANYDRFFIDHSSRLDEKEASQYELFKYSDEIYATQMPMVNFVPNSTMVRFENFQLNHGYFNYTVDDRCLIYADAFEPHLILHESISDQDLCALGEEINTDIKTFPLGINITAYQVKSADYLIAKTYERGVRRVTQSCGTGATCVVLYYLQNKKGIVTVLNPGGKLIIQYNYPFVELKGPAILMEVSTGRALQNVRHEQAAFLHND